jgi:hypothetical protein
VFPSFRTVRTVEYVERVLTWGHDHRTTTGRTGPTPAGPPAAGPAAPTMAGHGTGSGTGTALRSGPGRGD